MKVGRELARSATVVLGLIFMTAAMAQSSSVKFHVRFSGNVDCSRPLAIRGVPISGDGTGQLNADGSASAELTETAFILSTTIHFAGRLGAPPTAAPGGSAQLRVAGRHSLLLIWTLPNNQLITRISVAGDSCSAGFEARLRPGKREYTLFDGSIYHYCDRPRVEQTSCEVR